MRYLIDTNIFLFHVLGNNLLDENVEKIIDDYENQIYISSESVKDPV